MVLVCCIKILMQPIWSMIIHAKGQDGENMVREENVKLMSRIAIYEKRDGKREIPINNFYKKDYVRVNVLKTIVSATIVYVLVLALTAIYKMDYILANILKVDYRKLVFYLLVIYGIWILVYWSAARILYAKIYEDSRSNIIIYNHNLKKLQEAAQKEAVKTKGGVGFSGDFIDL